MTNTQNQMATKFKFPLTNKVAIVTGSSRGIGRAIAQRLGQEGAKVVVTYMNNNEQAEEVVSKIQLSGAEAIAIQVDVRKIADVRRLFQKTIEHYGKVDILINNAAGTNVFKPTAIVSEEDVNNNGADSEPTPHDRRRWTSI